MGQPPFSLPLCTAGFKRSLDRILVSDQHRSTQSALKTGRSVVLHVVEFKAKPKVFQTSHIFSTPQIVRHSSISYLLPLGRVSLFVSVICLPVSLGNFTVERVRFISIWCSPRNRSIFQDVFKSSVSKDGQPQFYSFFFL